MPRATWIKWTSPVASKNFAGVSRFCWGRPEAPSDESLRRESELEVARVAADAAPAAKNSPSVADSCSTPPFNSLVNCCRRHRIPQNQTRRQTPSRQHLKQSLTDLVEQDDQGRPRLTFALPDATALDGLTTVLVRLLVQSNSA